MADTTAQPSPSTTSTYFAIELLVANIIILFIGCILNGILLYTLIKARRSLRRRHDIPPSLVLITGLFTWALTQLVAYVCELANGGLIHNTFGILICQFQVITIALTVGIALSGHMLLALERYKTIIQNRVMEPKEAILNVVGLLISQIILLTIYMRLTVRPFEPIGIGIVCIFQCTSPSVVDMWFPVLQTVMFGHSFLVLAAIYMRIYLRVFDVNKKTLEDFVSLGITDSASTPPSSPVDLSPARFLIAGPTFSEIKLGHSHQSSTTGPQTAKHLHRVQIFRGRKNLTTDDLQRRVLHRCVVILLSFQACYIPTLVAYLYRIITHQDVHPALDIFGSLFSIADISLTPIMFLYFDGDYRAAARRFVWEPAVEAMLRLAPRCMRTKQASGKVHPDEKVDIGPPLSVAISKSTDME
ncbi:hypothetical protein HK102_003457 [Quaeritorhiza haematococci]|nr:hypothetical protein HK102_003457 [Quaeritorhiza haematococci]